MALNPPTQYATDRNLRARQRLWEHQDPPFDLVRWVLDIAGLHPGSTARVLDAGCGNGAYLARLRAMRIDAVGCDLSLGMLASAGPHPSLVNADVTHLPLASSSFDVVLAPHMLYHVPDREAAAHELRRVLRPGGRCVAVTNGGDHMRSLRALIEASVRATTPSWQMRNPSTHAFSLENGGAQLGTAFEQVACIPASDAAPVVLTDASVVADYVASIADHYQPETDRPWSQVVRDVRRAVQSEIDGAGTFITQGVSGAFSCG